MEDVGECHIALASGSDEARDGDEVGLAEIDSSILVDIADGELDGGMILGGDETISVVTLAGKIDVGHLVLLVDGAFHLLLGVLDAACLKSHLWKINYSI